MDRNQVIGITLIILLFFGYVYLNQPSQEEIDRMAAQRDSIETFEANLKLDSIKNAPKTEVAGAASISNDSNNAQQAIVEPSYITLQNDKVRVQLTNIGGKVSGVELLKYKRSDSTELILTTPESTKFGFNYEEGNPKANTNEAVFNIVSSDATSAKLEAKLNGGVVTYTYSLDPESYKLGFKSNWTDLRPNTLKWENQLFQQEKVLKTERNVTTIYYKEKGSKATYMSETADDDEVLNEEKVEWISFKQQFFNQTLVPETPFESAKVKVVIPQNDDYLKTTSAELSLPNQSEHAFWFYLGPNHYQTLNRLDIGLESIIPLGWGIFGWVNKFLIIPVFNFLSGFIDSYGLIIFILTIFIKVILLFFTYKAFMSGAKMRALKPELDELKKKHKGDAQAMQVEQMQLYKTTGVSPFGGCLPMILQFPILIAMFRFFPSSIELRQQGFLWADDLSTYDSIWDFGYVPILDSVYGDHVSLFALLMTVTTFIYTVINQKYQPTSQQQPGMKYLPYIMPVFFLSFLNSYSSALSYYYFLANLISIGQTYLFKAFVDEKKLREKIETNKNKPKVEKAGGGTGAMAKMQKMLEQQQNKQKAIEKQRAEKNKKKK